MFKECPENFGPNLRPVEVACFVQQHSLFDRQFYLCRMSIKAAIEVRDPFVSPSHVALFAIHGCKEAAEDVVSILARLALLEQPLYQILFEQPDILSKKCH